MNVGKVEVKYWIYQRQNNYFKTNNLLPKCFLKTLKNQLTNIFSFQPGRGDIFMQILNLLFKKITQTHSQYPAEN